MNKTDYLEEELICLKARVALLEDQGNDALAGRRELRTRIESLEASRLPLQEDGEPRDDMTELREVAKDFERLGALPENGNPIFCSRMHFREWSETIRTITGSGD